MLCVRCGTILNRLSQSRLMPGPKILVIPGSLRSGSHNVRLAALASKELMLAEADVTRISLADYPLPIFDADLAREQGPPPPCASSSSGCSAPIAACSSPAPNTTPRSRRSSRTPSTGYRSCARPAKPQLAAFQDRVFALGAASPGRSGGMQSLIALRQVLAVGCRALVIPEQITIPNAATAFDEMDQLTDARAAAQLKTVARRLVDYARLLR